MTDAVRTPDGRFADLERPVAPRELTRPDGLRRHHVDERPAGHFPRADAPTDVVPVILSHEGG